MTAGTTTETCAVPVVEPTVAVTVTGELVGETPVTVAVLPLGTSVTAPDDASDQFTVGSGLQFDEETDAENVVVSPTLISGEEGVTAIEVIAHFGSDEPPEQAAMAASSSAAAVGGVTRRFQLVLLRIMEPPPRECSARQAWAAGARTYP